MATDADLPGSRAEVNFVRLARACESQAEEAAEARSASAQDNEVEEAAEWRRLEAYARRLRELLEEIRRGEQQPTKQRPRKLQR